MIRHVILLSVLLSGCVTDRTMPAQNQRKIFFIEQRGEGYSLALYQNSSTDSCVDGYLSKSIQASIIDKSGSNRKPFEVEYTVPEQLEVHKPSTINFDGEDIVSSSAWIKINGKQIFLSCSGKDIIKIISISPKE